MTDENVLVKQNDHLGLVLEGADFAEPAMTGSRGHAAAVYGRHMLLLSRTKNYSMKQNNRLLRSLLSIGRRRSVIF
jgi:hypothetical protein